MFIAIIALFIIAPNWKQLKCPSSGKWSNEVWHNQPHRRILLSDKKEQATDTRHNLDASHRNCVSGESPCLHLYNILKMKKLHKWIPG